MVDELAIPSNKPATLKCARKRSLPTGVERTRPDDDSSTSPIKRPRVASPIPHETAAAAAASSSASLESASCSSIASPSSSSSSSSSPSFSSSSPPSSPPFAVRWYDRADRIRACRTPVVKPEKGIEKIRTTATALKHLTTDEVEITKWSNARVTEEETGLVFNVDGAKNFVAPSLLVQHELGLFAGEFIPNETIVTWYTGKNYTKESKLAEVESKRSDDTPSYVVTVDHPVTRQTLYCIDGADPDSRYGGRNKCHGAYINHHPTRFNVELQTVRMNGIKGVFKYRTSVKALRDIQPGEEMLLHYGESYHELLKEAGKLIVEQWRPHRDGCEWHTSRSCCT